MTRFQIVGIFEDKICTSTEFNGDGYFTGHGHEICSKFSEIKTEKGYVGLVSLINRTFRYERPLIYNNIEEQDLDFYNYAEGTDYYSVWFSDYLYIKNFTKEDKVIFDDKGTKIIIHPQGWVTLNFGELYVPRKEDEKYKNQPSNNIEINEEEVILCIIRNCGWDIDASEEDRDITLIKYSPAGEDLSFSVNKENIVEEIKQYAENFDVDEHVKMWIDAPGAPSSIRQLLEDAEWIENDLQELVEALERR